MLKIVLLCCCSCYLGFFVGWQGEKEFRKSFHIKLGNLTILSVKGSSKVPMVPLPIPTRISQLLKVYGLQF